jgi:hypothetical protein
MHRFINNVTCSRHDVAEKCLSWRYTIITHSLTHMFIITINLESHRTIAVYRIFYLVSKLYLKSAHVGPIELFSRLLISKHAQTNKRNTM